MAGTRAQAQGLTGRVWAGETKDPIAGAKVRLLNRGDSTFTQADGSYHLPFESSLGAGNQFGTGWRKAAFAGGRLYFHSPGATKARIELFDMRGKRLAYRSYRTETAGLQSLDIAALLAGLHGVGWLRLHAGGRVEELRLFKLGNSAYSGSLPGSERPAIRKGVAAAKTAVDEILDTITVEKAGYYSWTRLVRNNQDFPGSGIELWKNSLDGIDPAEAQAWKEFLMAPAQVIRVSRGSISLPAGISGSVLTADGRLVEHWSASACSSEAAPQAIHLAYAHSGVEYRDTVNLAPLWEFFDSFRTQVDSQDGQAYRFHSTWTWPGSLSALPERDWMEVYQLEMHGDQHFISHPDVFQRGGVYGIEGSFTRFGEFDPRAGELTMTDRLPSRVRFSANFTLARRDGHDLRIQLEDRDFARPEEKIVFANAWPMDGVRPGQELMLQAAPGSFAPIIGAMLEYRLEGDEKWRIIRLPWAGEPLVWKLPFPVRSEIPFRIRANRIELMFCPDGSKLPYATESPLLKLVPEPGDTSVAAYEPNDSPGTAVMVPRATWISAAWDMRIPVDQGDVDYYRFRAEAGERLRLTLENPSSVRANVYQKFSLGNQFLYVEAGKSGEMVYSFSQSGEYEISISSYAPSGPTGGHYRFRLNPLQ